MFHIFCIDLKKTVVFILLVCVSCKPSREEKQVRLYNNYCSKCHITPTINSLPKHLWEKEVLPEMAARLGVKEDGFQRYEGLSLEEMDIVFASGVYPSVSTISQQDWNLLKEYILTLAPDSLAPIANKFDAIPLELFKPKKEVIDSIPGSIISFLDVQNQNILYGDIRGNLKSLNFEDKKVSAIVKVNSAVVGFTDTGSNTYLTEIGKLEPTEWANGKIYTNVYDSLTQVKFDFLRPVNNLVVDLNNDGLDELIVSEFGNLTGRLSLLTLKDGVYKKSILLDQPGAIRVISEDMNADGKKDLIVLTAQGDESITILYQETDLKFKSEKVLRFSPIYGSSWFDLVDFDADGDLDIITVNGDNADKTYIQKPYHGLRIFINSGNNKFTEKYFYPLNGATRFVANDFDQDGDVDIAVISTFPDYQKHPEYAFVYLENINSEKFNFQAQIFNESINGRWFLIDTGDVDQDGDVDIVMSSFSYSFTPVPIKFQNLWAEKNVDLMILENKLK